MNIPPFNRDDDDQIISSMQQLENCKKEDYHKNREDVRVDESIIAMSSTDEFGVEKSHCDEEYRRSRLRAVDASMKKEPASTEFSSNNDDDHDINIKCPVGEKDHLDIEKSPSKTTLISVSMNHDGIKRENSVDKAIETNDTHGDTTPIDGCCTITNNTSRHSYYTDNIAAACAATNDELTSSAPVDESLQGEGDTGCESERRQKRAKTKRASTGTGKKSKKKGLVEQVFRTTPEDETALIITELQREKLSLLQENVALRQNVQHLSTLLETVLASPARGDHLTRLLAQLSVPYHQSLLQLPSSSYLQTSSSPLGERSDNSLLRDAPQVGSLLGLGEVDQQHRIASILSSLGANPIGNPLFAPSALSQGQSPSIFEQLLLGAPSSINRSASVGAASSTNFAAITELQRYLRTDSASSRATSSRLGGSSMNTSNSSSRDEGVATELGTTATGPSSSLLAAAVSLRLAQRHESGRRTHTTNGISNNNNNNNDGAPGL